MQREYQLGVEFSLHAVQAYLLNNAYQSFIVLTLFGHALAHPAFVLVVR